MVSFFALDLLSSSGVLWAVARRLGATWAVFALCAVLTGAGVFISTVVFPPTGTLSNSQLFLLGVVIAAAMMLVTYGAKYANAASRDSFTPVDLLQYLVQGFLWPATWPALAEKVGQVKIDPAPAKSLLDLLSTLVT